MSIKRFSALAVAIVLSGCNQTGLLNFSGNNVDLGKEVQFSTHSSPRIEFTHSSNWQIRQIGPKNTRSPLIVLNFRPPQFGFATPSVKSLWKATSCALFNDPTKSRTADESNEGRPLLIKNIQSNYPKSRVTPQQEKFINVNYDEATLTTVTARIASFYDVEVIQTLTRNGVYAGSKKATAPWYSFGQSQKLGDNHVYVFCKGDPDYRNHFYALADTIGQSLKVYNP